MTVVLDGRRMTDRESTHDYLAAQLCLPEWYGRNLDALYDLLTAGVGVDSICVTGADALDGYAQRVLHVLADAAKSGGPALTVQAE